jgi:hypothetical protein
MRMPIIVLPDTHSANWIDGGLGVERVRLRARRRSILNLAV